MSPLSSGDSKDPTRGPYRRVHHTHLSTSSTRLEPHSGHVPGLEFGKEG